MTITSIAADAFNQLKNPECWMCAPMQRSIWKPLPEPPISHCRSCMNSINQYLLSVGHQPEQPCLFALCRRPQSDQAAQQLQDHIESPLVSYRRGANSSLKQQGLTT